MNVRALARGLQIPIRAAVAAGLSLAIARYFEFQYPLYAFIAAIIVIDLQPSQTRRLGFRRMAATVVGAVCGAALTPLLPQNPLGIALGVTIAMLVSQIVRAPDGARMAGYICGIVMIEHSAEPWTYAYLRFVETALGVVVAWLISYVPKLIKADAPTGVAK